MNQDFIEDFKKTLTVWEGKLLTLSESQSETPRQPGKWCPKEIIGHLIDSVSNNHQRFVRAQFQGDLIFPGYEQDRWIDVQNYKAEQWKLLVNIWKNFNTHLLHAIAQIPDDVLKRQHHKHNFDDIAWKPVPANQPSTLEYFIEDYLAHMKHHLNQVGESLHV